MKTWSFHSADQEADGNKPWLTAEKGIYIALAVGALLVRLGGLGRAPLLATEIPTALATWDLLHGGSPTEGYVPLLLLGQLPLFWLHASEFAARLLTAVVGAGLTLAPWVWRKRLGRIGALAAAAFVAFSPGWVYMGRTADGAVVVVALVCAAVWFSWQYLEGQDRAAPLAAGFLALSLAAGAVVYTLWTAVALVGLIMGQCSLRRSWIAIWQEAWRVKAGWVFAGVLVAVSTAWWINPAGLGATVELVGAWAKGLNPFQTGLPWYHALLTLGVYEPLMVVLAGVGAYWGWRRGARLEKGLLLWLAYALFLATALGHRDARWLAGTLLPLTILAACGAQALGERAWSFVEYDWAVLPLFMGFVAFLYLQVVFYVKTLEAFYWIYAGFGLGLLICGMIGYGLWFRPRGAESLALLMAFVVLAIPELRGTTALALDRARDPWEPMLSRPCSSSLVTFEAILFEVAFHLGSDPREIEILYEETLDPWMAWTLREYPHARATIRVKEPLSAPIVITGPWAEGERFKGYVGRPFALWEEPVTQGLAWHRYLAWAFFREPNLPRVQETFWLWVRMPGDQ